MSRDAVGLDVGWRFQIDLGNGGESAGYWRADYDSSRWREVNVPCSFEQGQPDVEFYVGTAWYRKAFHVPEAWRGRRVNLLFQAVNYHARVWVNGQLVGQHDYGFLPFEFAVQDLLQFGAENSLVVKADNEPRPGEAPGMNVGWRPYGGILREVALEATGRCAIAGLRVVAEPRDAGVGQLAVRVRVSNDEPTERRVALSIEVANGAGEAVGGLASAEAIVGPGGEAEIAADGTLSHVTPWSPEHPALYTVRARLWSGSEEIDALETRVGFRSVEARDGRLLLNGRPIKLWGFNRHEDSPLTGGCADLATVRRDLSDMKTMGCNFVRLCHYPHDPGELDLCDELGLLAMGEIPVYGSTGMAEDEAQWRQKIDAAERQLSDLIRRDWNHPSVIFWSVSNETLEQHPHVVEGNRALVRRAKEVDPTRLAVHVSSRWSARHRPPGDTRPFELDDVICVNAYPWMSDLGRSDWARLPEQTRWWEDALAQIHDELPDKPILVTEFGSQSFEGVFDSTFGEDRHAAVIEANLAGMTAPYVCGATIWVYADHAWGFWGFADPLARTTTAPYGVLTRARKPKTSAYNAVKRLFTSRQREQSD